MFLWILSGELVRENIQFSNSPANLEHYEKQMREISTALILFTDNHIKKGQRFYTQDEYSGSIDIVCVVWYSCGDCEELTEEQLIHFLSNKEWTQQILLIQAYVNPVSIGVGSYSQEIIDVPSMHHAKTNQDIALDCMTKCVVEYAQAAYERSDVSKKKSISKDAVSIQELTIEFKIDNNNTLWISHPISLSLKYPGTENIDGKFNIDPIKSARQEAFKCAQSLQLLLKVAVERKVSWKQRLSHIY